MKTKKEKKVFSHPFLNRWTIPGVIILSLGAYIIGQQVIGSVLGALCPLLQGMLAGLTGTELTAEAAQNTALIGTELWTVFAAFFLLSVYWRWFYPEYKGSLPGEKIRFWLIFAGATVLFVLIFQLLTFVLSGSKIGFPSLVNLCAALMAGCFEEAVFRGIAGSYLMRQWPGEKGILKTMITTSIIFALVHAMNLLSGAPLVATIYQILNAFGMGMFLCAVFLRSGSLWPGIIIHTLFDTIAFMDVTNIAEGGVMTGEYATSWTDLIGFAFIALSICAALYLASPSVRGDIARIWREKWHLSPTA